MLYSGSVLMISLSVGLGDGGGLQDRRAVGFSPSSPLS